MAESATNDIELTKLHEINLKSIQMAMGYIHDRNKAIAYWRDNPTGDSIEKRQRVVSWYNDQIKAILGI